MGQAAAPLRWYSLSASPRGRVFATPCREADAAASDTRRTVPLGGPRRPALGRGLVEHDPPASPVRGGLSVVFDRQQARGLVVLGGQSHATATMTNQGAVSETYFFEVLGPLKEWASINPPRTTIAPGAEASVHLGFRIQPPPGSPALAFRGSLFVRSGHESIGGHRGHHRGPTRQKAKARFLAQSPRGRWAGRYAVGVHNAGNFPIRVRLTAVGVGDDLSFAVSPSLFALEPAQSELGLVEGPDPPAIPSRSPAGTRFSTSQPRSKTASSKQRGSPNRPASALRSSRCVCYRGR